MRKLSAALVALAALVAVSAATAAPWSSSVTFTNTVVSKPVAGGGYPVPPGATRPEPGTCGPQSLNSNHSESWLAVRPGSEDIIGNSKFFIGKWSTFYDFHLGSYTILGGLPLHSKMTKFSSVAETILYWVLISSARPGAWT